MKQQEVCKGRRLLIRVGTLNIETMTGRGRELADMMERRNIVPTGNKVKK